MGVHEGQDPERRRVVVRDVDQPDLDAVQRLGEFDHADAQTHLDLVVIEEACRSPVYLEFLAFKPKYRSSSLSESYRG